MLAIEIKEAYDIAYGHSWEKHKKEWINVGINNEQELAEHLENVMTNPSEYRELEHGRRACWDEATGTLVVENPSETDNGTAFVPSAGKYEFDNLN